MAYDIYQLRITLSGSEPPIWRRILVDKSEPLSDFHELIQSVMGWGFAHLHQFHAGQRRGKKLRGAFQPVKNEDRTRLKDVLLKPNDRILYEYDFGDGWEHDIVLEEVQKISPRGQYPWILEGSGACPPEDSGGIPGYYAKLAALADPAHDDHEWTKEWLGEDFDPEFFDPDVFNSWMHEARQQTRQQTHDDDIHLIESSLGRTLEHDGYTLEVQIYRSDETDWHLEVVNEAGASIVWDDLFETDQEAWEEFERTLREEGIEAFK